MRVPCSGALIASLLVVNLQTKYSWTLGYAVPTVAFGIALGVYLMGTPLYKFVPPGGSAITRIGQVWSLVLRLACASDGHATHGKIPILIEIQQ